MSGNNHVAKQIEQIQSVISLAQFDDARNLVGNLNQNSPGVRGKLYARYATIKLDIFQDIKRPIDNDLDDLELMQGNLSYSGKWPRHWYIQSWFMAPLLNSHPVDVFYLYSLCSQLDVVKQRQDCLVQAMHYAVQYSEHGFITYLNQLHPYDETWLASAFYRSMMEALRAAYSHDGKLLNTAFLEMTDVAENPLQKFEVMQMRKRFSHLLID